MGIVKAVSISKSKGSRKVNVPEALLKEGSGIIGDAHAGSSRQISLLADESIEKMRKKGLNVGPGDFAENVTTEGIDLLNLKRGDRLGVGGEAIVEITEKGKECRARCNIYYQAGDCVMPREGIFANVIKGGAVKPGDKITILC
ncbi:MAG: molybdenum cofactor sulfurase [Omnitrophica bacterium RIFCSPLOWO2_02_FULL_45_16]|nr:MAG: molybdenum cofactor sulfurase [Omnitrophica bacterium RIFCSPLOWO2_01_FULL_45_24]OGW99677.1 MAG: molybdenum cofactor sulfurase [Omnitrophica bacterium RIFCSPLOWO2_02_FULL_45_16]